MEMFERFERRISRLWDMFDAENKEFESLFMNNDDDDKNIESYSMSFHRDIGKSPDGSYSMSYHYETGMDEPEIKIVGNPSQSELDKFLNGIKGQHGKSLSQKEIKALSSPESKITEKDYTIEMPGLSKDDISYEINGKKISIKGEKGKIKYQKTLRTTFDIKKVDIKSDNGLITIHLAGK